MASITVDVDLDDFEDSEIIEAATYIARSFKPDENSPYLKAKAALLQKLCSAISKALNDNAEEDDLQPTTAARLSSMDQLREYVVKHPELYRFAGEA